MRRGKLLQEDKYPGGISLGSSGGESCVVDRNVEEYLKTTTPQISADGASGGMVSHKVVERGDEATTSPEGLNYPKAKHPLEWRWTRRSATEADLPIANTGT
ncbi:hypothetical protein GW17_00048266 [Ensete ventricosum]|nr:hypothetical protein GW17_00048266 [Ensete ventricosum]